MGRWFTGLQFRLILGFTLVLALALAGVGFYAGYVADREVDQFGERLEAARAARVEEMISDSFQQNRSLKDLQSIVERAGLLFERRVVVTDADGIPIADSHAKFGNPFAARRDLDRFHPISAGSGDMGLMILEPSQVQAAVAEPAISRIVSSLNWSLVWTGLAAVAGGSLLATVMSRRILAPVRELTGAAANLGQGNLGERVSVASDDEIGRLGRTFNTMADRLEKAEEQRMTLMADVAHELRTPLSNIQGYLEAIRDGLMTPSPSNLDILHGQALHLGRLVEDLRLISLADAGRLPLDAREASLAELVERTADACRPAAEAKDVTLTVETPHDGPAVTLDPTRIAQALTNLLDNAILHTPAGGTVTVTAEINDAVARVAVADTGEGIAAGELEQVFGRFYRVDPSRNRATGGTGLGLTIARQLVEAHGGRIWVESQPPNGATFIFELPIGGGE